MRLSEKLKKARRLIGETQSVAAINSGITQRDISYMEAGKKKYLNTEYLLYMHKNGFDLNSLLDETKELTTIENNLFEKLNKLQKELKEKEEMIRLLKDAVELRDHKIEELEDLFANEKAII